MKLRLLTENDVVLVDADVCGWAQLIDHLAAVWEARAGSDESRAARQTYAEHGEHAWALEFAARDG